MKANDGDDDLGDDNDDDLGAGERELTFLNLPRTRCTPCFPRFDLMRQTSPHPTQPNLTQPETSCFARVAVSSTAVHRVPDCGLTSPQLERVGRTEEQRVAEQLLRVVVHAASKAAQASRLRAA